MKSEQKEEFLGLVKEQYNQWKSEMTWIHFAILAIDKQLDDLDWQLEQIPGKIEKLNSERERLEVSLVSYKEQLEAFVLAENELVN